MCNGVGVVGADVVGVDVVDVDVNAACVLTRLLGVGVGSVTDCVAICGIAMYFDVGVGVGVVIIGDVAGAGVVIAWVTLLFMLIGLVCMLVDALLSVVLCVCVLVLFVDVLSLLLLLFVLLRFVVLLCWLCCCGLCLWCCC